MARLSPALPLFLLLTAAVAYPQPQGRLAVDKAEAPAAVREAELRQRRAHRVDAGLDGEVLLQMADASSAVISTRGAERIASALKANSASFKAALAEYVAMTLFVTIGCGCAMGIAKEPGSAWVLQVSLTFGLAITSLAYSVGAYSGGQINCAVTFGLVLIGHITVGQGILNFVAQMLGSLTGAYLLCAIFPKEQDRTQGLGSNAIGDGFSKGNAFIGEAMMTFVLMFVVLETAVNPNSEANRALACVAIGFAVFLAHTVLIPIDGCSINPTRSFGPAFVAQGRYAKAGAFKDMGVFWAAPLMGSALAVGAYGVLRAV